MNPARGAVPATSIEVRISRDVTLPGRAWCAESPRALIAVLHGLGEHSGRYAALAESLVRASYTVVALDLPGHGAAGGVHSSRSSASSSGASGRGPSPESPGDSPSPSSPAGGAARKTRSLEA